MTREEHAAAGVATALLAGPWAVADMRKRVSTALGSSRTPRWVVALVDEVQAAYRDPPVDRPRELAAVAAGRLGASIQSDSLPWDWLPGAALVRGAGGAAEVISAAGHQWNVAGNRQAVADIAALLAELG